MNNHMILCFQGKPAAEIMQIRVTIKKLIAAYFQQEDIGSFSLDKIIRECRALIPMPPNYTLIKEYRAIADVAIDTEIRRFINGPVGSQEGKSW